MNLYNIQISMAAIKRAAAESNRDLGLLGPARAEAIIIETGQLKHRDSDQPISVEEIEEALNDMRRLIGAEISRAREYLLHRAGSD